jgi:hypothetical protein
MQVLTSTIQYIKLRRVHKKQKRTALHMLALSGVVRPSHIEFRYVTPIASITAFRTQPIALEHPKTQLIPSPPENHDIGQRTRSLSSAIIQFAKNPVMFRWNKQTNM